MVKVALLIISNARNQELYNLLITTVKSAIKTCGGYKLSIYCAEKDYLKEAQLNELQNYNVNIINQSDCFNYNNELNKLVNISKKEQNPDYFILANSDLIFKKNCIDKIVSSMQQEKILSASPYEPIEQGIERGMLPSGKIEYGYDINLHIAGWCIFCHKSVFERIGEINTDVSFWYSDNVYADQLKKQNIKHALITGALCEHFGSSTLKQQNKTIQENYTQNEWPKYMMARKNIGLPPLVLEERKVKSLEEIKKLFYHNILLYEYDFSKSHHNRLIRKTILLYGEMIENNFNPIVFFKLTAKKISQKNQIFLWSEIKNKLSIEHSKYARDIRWKLIWWPITNIFIKS